MMAEIVHFNSTGINVKIRPSVESDVLGKIVLELLRHAAQKASRLREVIIFGGTYGAGACMEPEPRVMMA